MIQQLAEQLSEELGLPVGRGETTGEKYLIVYHCSRKPDLIIPKEYNGYRIETYQDFPLFIGGGDD